LDVVAYRARDNHLKVVECKRYLDSPGVKLRGFDASNNKEAQQTEIAASCG
jgi:hypothetical protein